MSENLLTEYMRALCEVEELEFLDLPNLTIEELTKKLFISEDPADPVGNRDLIKLEFKDLDNAKSLYTYLIQELNLDKKACFSVDETLLIYQDELDNVFCNLSTEEEYKNALIDRAVQFYENKINELNQASL